MSKYGNYLADKDFLKFLTNMNIKNQLVKIEVLNWEEKPIAQISSSVISANFNIDGKSCVRRTGSLSLVAQQINVENYLSLNRKISVFIGYINNTKRYQEYDIFWFPLGVYIITGLSITHNLSNVSINLSLKDKMCLLNGEIGGTFTSAVILDSYDTIDENGEEVIKRPTIFQIIRELINHHGREPLNKIIISDLDTRVKQVMRWFGQNPLYILNKDNQYEATIDINKAGKMLDQGWSHVLGSPFESGYDVGYIYTDFSYPGELVADAGTSITQALDKIVNVLGNFEYFYDLEGNFVFQEIKNYLNNAENVYLKDSLENKNLLPEYLNTQKSDIYQVYAMNINRGKSEFDFSNEKFIISYANTPQYTEIKNDFMIWGIRKTADKKEYPIRYHLVIDKKPTVGNSYITFPYEEESLYGNEKTMIVNWHSPLIFDSIKDLPQKGVVGFFYYVGDLNGIFKWDYIEQIKAYTYVLLTESSDIKIYLKVLENQEELPEIKDAKQNIYYFVKSLDEVFIRPPQTKVNEEPKEFWRLSKNLEDINSYEDKWRNKIFLQRVTTKDWRTELYFQGVSAEPYGLNSNYYYNELKNQWPKIYDIKPDNIDGTNDSGFKEEYIKHPNTMDYYLDFIDSSFADIQSISVENIGRRQKVLNEQNGINCMFEPYIPDLILIPQRTQGETELLRQECILRGQDFIQIDNGIYDNLIIGGTFNSAYQNIRQLLNQFVSYNETIQIQTLPMFFLQPNIRIKLYDSDSRIYGDYIINSMSFNIDTSGSNQLSINASRALERI